MNNVNIVKDCVSEITHMMVDGALVAGTAAAQYSSAVETDLVHTEADTSNTVAASSAEDLAGIITLINELKGDYNTHRVSDVFHVAADTVNAVAAADAAGANWAAASVSVLALINEEKADYTAHLSAAGIHSDTDLVDIISSPDATTEATSITLGNELLTDYNLHCAAVSVKDTDKVVFTKTLDTGAKAGISELHCFLTATLKASAADTTGNYKWQARSSGGTWVDLHTANSHADLGTSEADKVVQGYRFVVEHLRTYPIDIRLIIQSEDDVKTVFGKVKNDSYVSVKLKKE